MRKNPAIQNLRFPLAGRICLPLPAAIRKLMNLVVLDGILHGDRSQLCRAITTAAQLPRVYKFLRRNAIDIVLLDFDLGECDGRQFLRLAKERGFQGKVLAVTAGVDTAVAAELIRSGISGRVSKTRLGFIAGTSNS